MPSFAIENIIQALQAQRAAAQQRGMGTFGMLAPPRRQGPQIPGYRPPLNHDPRGLEQFPGIMPTPGPPGGGMVPLPGGEHPTFPGGGTGMPIAPFNPGSSSGLPIAPFNPGGGSSLPIAPSIPGGVIGSANPALLQQRKAPKFF